MRPEPVLNHTAAIRPRVTAYPRHDAAEQSFTVQMGGEWVVVRWKPSDAPSVVAKQLRDVANWLDAR